MAIRRTPSLHSGNIQRKIFISSGIVSSERIVVTIIACPAKPWSPPYCFATSTELDAAGISGPKGINYIYGLGGRDVRVESIQHVFAELEKIAATGETGETYRYLDVRE